MSMTLQEIIDLRLGVDLYAGGIAEQADRRSENTEIVLRKVIDVLTDEQKSKLFDSLYNR